MQRPNSSPSNSSPARAPRSLPDGLLLCGGRSERMGGVDKGLTMRDGRPAVAIVANLLAPVCGQVLISANRNLSEYAALDLGPVVRDTRPDFPGPLAGIEAARNHLIGDLLLVLPCDMPGLAPQVPARLLQRLDENPQLELVYAASGGDDHYLVAALRRRALEGLGPYLDRGGRAVRHWYRGLRHERLVFGDEAAMGFANLNTPEEWDQG